LTVRVLVDVPAADGERWRRALAAAYPGGDWLPDDADDTDVLVAWRPRAERFVRTRVRRAIFNLGAGVDALLALPTLPADVPVYRLTDAGMAEQMAQYATAAVLRAFRELDEYAAQQKAGQWRARPPRDKATFGVAVLGLGVLGRAVVDALRPFGFPLHGWARTPATLDGVTVHAGDDALRACLARAAVCICLLPSTPATRDLMDATRLSWLPRGAHLVNLARGELVVDADLIAALDDGRLAGATLDVFRTEPLPAAHPFWHHPGITITPHVSAATLHEASAAQVADGIRRLDAGREPAGRVDRVRGY
jgi:glyoxylate/hydroxypyruvate reductase A